MTHKQPNTPRFRVRAALRQLWLRSRERQQVLKRDGYCCVHCGIKQSRAKGAEVSVEVHHLDGIDWEDLIDLVYARLLVSENRLETVCKDCHKKLEDL